VWTGLWKKSYYRQTGTVERLDVRCVLSDASVCRNLFVDENEARGERSGGYLLQSVLVVGGAPGPGARTLSARPADPGDGLGRAAAAAVRRPLRRRSVHHDQTATTTASDGPSRVNRSAPVAVDRRSGHRRCI